MNRRRVLFICHNHPSVRPGGAEGYAHELFRAFESSDEFDAVFLAKGGPPLGIASRPHVGTYFSTVDHSPDEYFFYTDGYEYDWLNGTLTDKDYYTKHLRPFLKALGPDVVHLQHTLFLGFDVIREIRNSLPDAVIVYTLHEYAPICHRDGQLLRTRDASLCTEASPRRCHECFPEISPQQFFLRKKFIQSQLDLVDLFIAPSQFLLERYVDWGIPRERIRFEENGRNVDGATARHSDRAHRDRLGFFGQFSIFKGVDVLLEAMRIIGGTGLDLPPWAARARAIPGAADPHLFINGANLELQTGPYQVKFQALLDATTLNVTMRGKYDRQALPSRMEAIDWVVIPSVWFENSPLVIQEAFLHGRPIICSDIGGMAEKVTDGVNGLHFRVGDARSLAETIERAVTTPGLWDELRAGIPPVYTVESHMKQLSGLYQDLLEARAGESETADAP